MALQPSWSSSRREDLLKDERRHAFIFDIPTAIKSPFATFDVCRQKEHLNGDLVIANDSVGNMGYTEYILL